MFFKITVATFLLISSLINGKNLSLLDALTLKDLRYLQLRNTRTAGLMFQEYNSICENYFVESFEINTWSAGLSKYLCTYFDDEVEEGTLENHTIDEVRNWTVKFVYQDAVPKEDIKFVKETYYKGVKTYY